MKAVVYEGARRVSVQDVPDVRIERSTDVRVRITKPNLSLNRRVGSVGFTGKIGVVGVFFPQDPGASDELAEVVLQPAMAG